MVVFTILVSAAQPIPGISSIEHTQLVSGEAVELEIRVARPASRALALVFDVIIELFLAVSLSLGIGILAALLGYAGLADLALLQGLMLVVIVVVFVGYPVAFQTLLDGRSPGKIVMGIRVVRDDGGPIKFRHALSRTLVSLALEWPGMVMPPITWTASLATMLLHPRGKRLGDLAAGTIVIHERSAASWGWVPPMPPQLAGWARTLDLTALDDGLALAVRHFLARNSQIAEPFRTRLGFSLALDVAARTSPPPPPGIPGWMYLTAVIAERNRRASRLLAAARGAANQVWPGLGAPPTVSEQPQPPSVPPQW